MKSNSRQPQITFLEPWGSQSGGNVLNVKKSLGNVNEMSVNLMLQTMLLENSDTVKQVLALLGLVRGLLGLESCTIIRPFQ